MESKEIDKSSREETPQIEESEMEQRVQKQEQQIIKLKAQILSMATDINRKNNEQQSQLQGVEAVWI